MEAAELAHRKAGRLGHQPKVLAHLRCAEQEGMRLVGWVRSEGREGTRGHCGAGMTSLATSLGVGPGVLWRGGGRGQGAQRGAAEGEPSERVGRGGDGASRTSLMNCTTLSRWQSCIMPGGGLSK